MIFSLRSFVLLSLFHRFSQCSGFNISSSIERQYRLNSHSVVVVLLSLHLCLEHRRNLLQIIDDCLLQFSRWYFFTASKCACVDFLFPDMVRLLCSDSYWLLQLSCCFSQEDDFMSIILISEREIQVLYG